MPFSFTSLQRLMVLGDKDTVKSAQKLASPNKNFGALSEELRGEIAASINAPLGPDGLPYASPVINMMVNPSTIQWSQTKRISKKNTLGGTVYFHFSDTNGQNNDILTMTFSGNTGYMGNASDFSAKRMEVDDELRKRAAKRRIWMDLYGLTREPVDLPGNLRNEFYIHYRTRMFPSITLIGFFSSVMQFTESADKPFSRDYSFSFTVTDTAPNLNYILDNMALGA